MTILSRSSVEPDLITAQCDVCSPQFLATTSIAHLVERGWLLKERGAPIDMCPHCRFEPAQGQRPRAERAAGLPADGGHLPNFFIIGAAKAGTTSLHAYLAQHPEIFMAEDKELRYFCDPDCASWRSIYRQNFPVDAPVRGESSTMYTRTPAIPGVAARMAALVPDAKLVYMVREPVERALASWREERFHDAERRSAEEAFAHPEDPYNPYLAASRYAEQLEEFLQHYPREQVLVLDQRDLAADAGALVDRVAGFLGVQAHGVDTSERLNEGSNKMQYGGLATRLRYSAPARLVRRTPTPVRRALMAPARRFLRTPIEAPQLDENLLHRIREALAPDAESFRSITGLAFDHWSV